MTTVGESSKKPAMKFASKGAQRETKINSKWKNVVDTDLGHVDFDEFKKRMYGQNGLPTPIAKRIVRNGIFQAAGFPPAMDCAELMVECAIHYDAQKRQIVAPDGRILAHLSEVVIQETFGIPEHSRTVYKRPRKKPRGYMTTNQICAPQLLTRYGWTSLSHQ